MDTPPASSCLHVTRLSWTPGPHVTLHVPQSPALQSAGHGCLLHGTLLDTGLWAWSHLVSGTTLDTPVMTHCGTRVCDPPPQLLLH